MLRKPAEGRNRPVPALPAVETIAGLLAAGGVRRSAELAAGTSLYLELLLRWNQRVSLTSLTDPAEILARHFAESFFGGEAAGIGSGKLLDVGSGAGFPALPLVMAAPGLEAVLLEPNLKKAAFLAEVCRKLELERRVRIERVRLEEYGGSAVGVGEFDFVTTRAVRISGDFLGHCRRLLTAGGKVVLWLGEEDAGLVEGEGGWEWGERIRIPGSARRVVVQGRPVDGGGNVSRETE